MAPGCWGCGPRSRGARDDRGRFGLWLRLDRAGRASVVTTVTQLGQARTAVAQIVAEELDLPLAAVTVTHVPVEPAFGQSMPPGITTFGSMGFKVALATVGPRPQRRDMLLRAAAAQWQVPLDGCRIEQGTVVQVQDGERLPFGALVDAAAKLTPPWRRRCATQRVACAGPGGAAG